jgi:hypothetical protein
MKPYLMPGSSSTFSWGIVLLRVVAGVAVAACDLPNELGGSIAAVHSLEFDTVDVWLADDDLHIDYLADDGALFGTHRACSLQIDTDEVPIAAGTPLDGDAFLDLVQVHRRSINGGDFPVVESGTLDFVEYSLDPGSTIAGTFEVVFVDEHTLGGRFRQRLREVGPP